MPERAPPGGTSRNGRAAAAAGAGARKAPCSVLLIAPEATLAKGIADAVTTQTVPARHREPAIVERTA